MKFLFLVALLLFTIVTFSTTKILATDAWPSDECENMYMLPAHKPSPNSQWTVGQINAILKTHNDARRSVSPMASKYQNSFNWGNTNQGMRMLVWDEKLAQHALNYMSACPGMVHSSSASRANVVGDNVTYSKAGENLAAGYGSSAYNLENIGVTGTTAWNDELVDNTWSYGCNPFDSGGTCYNSGHYSAIVSARTWAVGCAYVYCASQTYKNYLICQYGETGNMNLGSNVAGTYDALYNKTSDVAEASPCQIIPGSTPTPSPPVATPSPPAATPSPPGATPTPPTPAPPATPSPPGATPSPPSSPGGGGGGASDPSSSDAVFTIGGTPFHEAEAAGLIGGIVIFVILIGMAVLYFTHCRNKDGQEGAKNASSSSSHNIQYQQQQQQQDHYQEQYFQDAEGYHYYYDGQGTTYWWDDGTQQWYACEN